MIKGKFQDLIKGENSLKKKEQASEPDSDKADLLELWGQEFIFYLFIYLFFEARNLKQPQLRCLK